MPEFVLIDRNDREFLDLPEFVQGYIEAMFFTESCCDLYTIDNWQDAETQEAVNEGQADGCLPSDAGFADIHPASLADIIADCEAFQSKAAADLALAYEMDESTRNGPVAYDAERAGNDFWYTRNGHGVGYWDRGLGDVGDRLSDAARDFGEAYVWFADHVDNGDAPFVYHQ